jgi:uncharacterized membrane protein YcjF (UPF0283 family)
MNRTLAAGGLVMVAMAMIALVDNWVRHVTADIGLWQFQLMRSVMVGVLMVVLAWIFGWRLRPRCGLRCGPRLHPQGWCFISAHCR